MQNARFLLIITHMKAQIFLEKLQTLANGELSQSLLIVGTLFIIGFISNYMLNLSFLKQLRSGNRKLKPRDLMLTSIFFGGPILLLFYMFEDYRAEDKLNKNELLITGIIVTIIQVALLVVLGMTGVIKL